MNSVEEFFRSCKISREIPGYRLLEIVVNYRLQKEDPVSTEEVLNYIESMGNKVIIPIVNIDTDRTPAEQWMIEAIRSRGFDGSIIDFLEIAAKEIKR